MASIPLPALDVKPPNIDPAAGIRNAYAIRGMQQQQQMGSIELQNAQQDQKDRQTISKLMQQYSGDLSKVIPAASTAGVNYKTVAGLQSTNLDIQTKLAGLTKDQLGNFSAVHDNAAGLIQSVLDAATPEAKDAAYQAGLKKIYANPQMYGITDASQIPAVRPPDETLKTQLALNMGQKEQAAQTMKQREVAAQELAANNRGGPDMAVFNSLVNGGGSAPNGQLPNPAAPAVQQQAPPANALAAGPQPQAVPVNPPATGDSQPAQAPVNPPATGNPVQVPPQAQGAPPQIVTPQGAPSVPVQPQTGVPIGQPPLSLQDKGQIGFDVAKGMTPEAAYAKLQQMKQDAKPDKAVPVDQREMDAWLAKNPSKDAADYGAYKAKLVPAYNFNLQNSGTTGNAADVAQRFGMTPAAFDQAAEKYYSSGQLPPAGRGGPALAMNKAIMNRVADLHPDGSLAGNAAAFAANKKSLEGLQKNFDQVTAFENTAGKNLDVFLGQAKKVIDSGNPLINSPLRSVTGAMGGTDQVAFDTARTTALTEISKVLNSSNASGVLSDSARHEVSGLITPNATLKQIVSAAGILKQDMGNRHQAYSDQIADLQKRLNGGGTPQDSGSAPTKASAPTPDTHAWSLSAWQQSHPKGDPLQAQRAAKAQGYTVVQ